MTENHEPHLHPDTRTVTAGRPARQEQAPVNPPVVLSSTYVSTGSPDSGDLVYARLGTETWLPLEEALAALEQAALPALVFGSGMGAISAALDLVPAGGEVIIPRHSYHASLVAARHLAERSRVRVTEVDIADTAQVVAAVQASADGGHEPVLWVESPTNPMLEVADLPALAEATHAVGGLVIADNTFATPLGQRPLGLGADVVVHSVTKYLAGHSDVVLGAALTDDAGLHERLRTRRSIGGAVAGPWEAWLALRGMRTLALRVERSQRNAAALAEHLRDHPQVVAVSYPGLPDHPQHARAAAQMSGFGSILTLRPAGGVRGAEALTRALRLWVPATSLGGVESSLERRRRFAAEAVTVPEDLLRLSVGIEDVSDLIADLDQALEVASHYA
ncbi:PLP-dependent transferase [Ruania suaedae]|uniref:trans-sulfuration enzyme family protein n=1 Tax=Ruania suaedae TaxID=2897774 RepID=UPI001E64A5F9|nr:aminotransferase class I/II-fold pyridoxal phosphate-dependent enzyme [Ruania suaedae]UFU01991.1 PLP-dependent transferase [Ruania suaedae]